MNHLIHPQGQTNHLALARGLASLGRGSDTNLVHMSNKEINGLQKLAMATGGSLTKNPYTGLYEAGWLENLIPMIAGGALAATGVGAPAAALLVGAGDAAVTKDWKSGLAAGLGAFGGAGVAQGLVSAGASAGASAAAPAATNAAAASTADVAPGFGATTGVPFAGDAPATISSLNTADTAGTQAPIATDVQSVAQAPKPLPYNMAGNSFSQNLSNMGQGISNLTSNPGAVGSSIYQNTGKLGLAGLAAPTIYNNYQQQNAAAAAAAAKLTGPQTYYSTKYNPGRQNPNYGLSGQNPIIGQSYSDPTPYTYTPVAAARGGMIKHYGTGGGIAASPAAPAPSAAGTFVQSAAQNRAPAQSMNDPQMLNYFQALMRPQQNTAAQTNNAAYMEGLNNQLAGNTTAPGVGVSPAQPPRIPNSSTGPITPTGIASGGLSYNPTTQSYSSPISALGRLDAPRTRSGIYMAQGGLLRGPGDAMSDSIPAVIHGSDGGQQPAALANDEFVIPGDVVSHLGNGSSDAGAKKLYSMMDRIRKARTGKTSQAPQINANKFLPA